MVAAAWAAVVALTGGFRLHLGSIRVSSRGVVEPAGDCVAQRRGGVGVVGVARQSGLAARGMVLVEATGIRGPRARHTDICTRYQNVAPALMIGLIVIGLYIYQWQGGLPFWLDEETIALNVRDRSFAELAGSLWLGQSAPFGWLVMRARGGAHAGHRGARRTSCAPALRDRDPGGCAVDRSTMDGTRRRGGVDALVLDRPVVLALSVRGQALHQRRLLGVAAARPRRLGDRGRRLGANASHGHLVAGGRGRTLAVKWRGAGHAGVRAVSVRRQVAPRWQPRRIRGGALRMSLARVLRRSLSGVRTGHPQQPVPP